MKSRLICSLSLVVFLLAQEAKAGGWLQGEDKGYFKLGQSLIWADNFYNGAGDRENITTTGVFITSLYGEYGISKKVDLIGYVPFFFRSTLNDVRFSSGAFQEGDQFNAIGDAQIGFKYGIRQNKNLVVSASLILGLPLGKTDGGDTKLLQSGDGEFNQMIRLEAGYSFKFPMYANIGIAFNNRTEDFSEEFRYDIEVGYTFKEKLLLSLKASSVNSFMNGNPSGSQTGIFSNNIEFFTFGPELAYFFNKKWGATAAVRGAASGQFILADPSYEAGIFMRLQ